MNLIRFVIKRKTFISMLFIGLTMLGYISYKNLPMELFPNVELPVMIVQISAVQEVSPAYVERNAVIPLEGAIGSLEGIESLDSYADNRSGMIFITYKDNTDIKYAYLKLQQKVESLQSTLGNEFIVNVLKVDTEQISNQFMDLQARGSGGTDRVRNVVDNSITEKLESIDGIASVEVFGGREKSVEIILDKDAAEAYGITPSQISSLINQNNQQRAFVGQVLSSDKKFFVNVTSESSDLSQLENIVVRPNGPVRLKDVAEIYFGVKEEETYSRVNGKESVTLRLVRDSQTNLIELSNAVKAEIEQLNEKLKSLDVEVVIQRNTADEMELNINTIIDLALTGGILAVIILWFFLRNFRLVATIGLAIPISIFTAFNLFYAYDISINSLTLIGMALAVGMLLDNSVVVLENIYRLAGNGLNRDDAVIQGTSEVWRSIVAATLTTITVFLPFVFSSNFLVSKFGTHIGVSIVSTLLISLFLALLFIPMITHFFLRKKTQFSVAFKKIASENRLIQIYIVLLKASMRFPARTIITSVVVFFASVFIALAVSINVTEEVESDTFNLYVEMPEGSTLESSDEVAQTIEERLANLDEKQDVISKIYEDKSTITIKLKEDFKDISDRSIEEIKEAISDKVDDIGRADISFDAPQTGQQFRGGGAANMGNRFQRMLGIGAQTERVTIKGNDFELMRSTAEDIQYYLESLTSIQSARLSVSGERPEIHLLFDQHLLSQFGIELTSIISELGTFRSEFSSNTKFKQDTEEYDITIKTSGDDEETQKTIDDLRGLQIAGTGGSTHELDEISQIVYASGMSSINRVNQEKVIEVTYRFLSEVNDSKALLEAARMEIDELIAGIVIPSGIAVEVIHEENENEEYYFLIAVAVLLIYMILASVFESAITPFVLMFSIPLAAIGSLLALIFTGNSLLNTNTLTGFLILLGVVVNNGIILIDYANILQKRGFSRPRALINAGLARVRPILITAITTIVAMIPLALGQAEYVAQIGAPFAITVIGGLTVSTLFTLIFIPTLYSGLYSALEWIYKLNWLIKIAQMALFAGLSYLIYVEIDSFVWQLVDLFLVLILIPGMTYFVLSSLRQAKTKLISADEPITITVRNVVKVYDQGSRFIREWKRGKDGQVEESFSWRKLADRALWQIPVIGFAVYFTYFYLGNGFWQFFFAHVVFFLLMYSAQSVIQPALSAIPAVKNLKLLWPLRSLEKLIYWGVPLLNLAIFQLFWENIVLVLIFGTIWYTLLLIRATSQKLTDEMLDEESAKTKFQRFRLRYYRIVRSIPVIGKKRSPFRALNKVSLEIGSGMFGLLGPNGAGKTTIMRIICGILEQSYGKVTINGLDRSEYREELQGLIGYLPQEFGMYENMTAYEFLNYQAILKNIIDTDERKKRIEQVLKSVHMFERKDEKIGSYSGGMKQRIGIAQILLHLPRILVVDEPTAGLDPSERIRFRNLLVELSRERVVIFSTHIIEDISSSCNRVAVMNEGVVRYLGEPSQMTKTAEGKVWNIFIEPKDFERVRNEMLVVHHMRDGDKIRIRCISEEQPAPGAKIIKPSLEDAYLYLQKQQDTTIFKKETSDG